MDIVGTPRGTAFIVVGIAAAVMVPAQESSVEVDRSALLPRRCGLQDPGGSPGPRLGAAGPACPGGLD